MSAIEYSLIFLSIVIGYVVTVALVGWGKMLKYFEYEKFSLEYLLWSLIVFFYLLFMWFWLFSFHIPYLDSYFWFTMILIRPVIIYFALELLVPDSHEGTDYAKHFFSFKRKFFAVISILWAYELGLIIIMGGSIDFIFVEYISNINTRDPIYLIFFPLSLSLVFVKSRTYLRVVTILLFVVMFAFLSRHMLLQYINGR